MVTEALMDGWVLRWTFTLSGWEVAKEKRHVRVLSVIKVKIICSAKYGVYTHRARCHAGMQMCGWADANDYKHWAHFYTFAPWIYRIDGGNLELFRIVCVLLSNRTGTITHTHTHARYAHLVYTRTMRSLQQLSRMFDHFSSRRGWSAKEATTNWYEKPPSPVQVRLERSSSDVPMM